MDEEQKGLVVPGSTAVGAVRDEAMVFDPSISQEDLIIPRVKLYQGNATEAEMFPNAKGGQILNSLTQEVLQGDFIPMIQSFEWIKFNARNAKDPSFDPAFAPGALIWKTTDPNDPNVAGDPEAWKNRTIKFLCYFVGQPMPLLLTLSKTSYNAGKQLLSIAKFSGKKQKYHLSTKKEEKEGNVYYVFHVGIAGMPTPEELEVVNGWTSDFRTKGFKEHDEQAPVTPQEETDWKE